MVSKKIKSSILGDIERIQSSLKEKNEAQRSAIYLQLVNVVDMLKKHIIDKQISLDKYITKLEDLTEDKIAKSLISSLNLDLNDIGDDYANLLKFESETKSGLSDIENIVIMLQISSMLSILVLRLQSIEITLNEVVDRIK